MPDAARKWLDKYGTQTETTDATFLRHRLREAVAFLRRLLEQNERLEAELGAIHGSDEHLEFVLNKMKLHHDYGEKIEQLQADLKERTDQYHLAHAKILSREAINEDLAKDYRALQRQVERLREYAWHKQSCRSMETERYSDCDCGLDEALEAGGE